MSALAMRFLEAQLAGDRHEALRVAMEDGIGKGASAEDVHLGIVAVSQREIGRLWQENRITVAEEHRATAISQLVLAHVFPHLEREKRLRCSVVVACVEGEDHDMAARIAADILDARGFDVAFLGANVPTSHLVKHLKQAPPDAVALSVTMSFHLSTLRAAVRAVREAMGDALPIVVGGEAVVGHPDLVEQLGVAVSRGTARDLAVTLQRLLRVEEARKDG
ncbi:MAG: cobalamin-binding protein [Polyangiaceae bacterium]|nr:cobalamin-binding protein [Polyangiaceae bacterium]